MSVSLSVIIAHRNEPDNLAKTVASIRDTAPKDSVEIIVVDDASEHGFHPDAKQGKIHPRDAGKYLADKQPGSNMHVFAWPMRQGHAACRTFGAKHAAGDWLLFTDAHMVFEVDWFKNFCAHINGRDAVPASPNQGRQHGDPPVPASPNQGRQNGDPPAPAQTLFCGPYIASRAEWEGTDEPPEIFWGACPYYWDEFPNEGIPLDILGIRPLRETKGTDAAPTWQVPAVIGANYFVSKSWFEHIGGLPGCYGWSIDEWPLSVKTWLCGGEVRILPDVRLRHVRHGPEHRKMNQAELLANKLAVAWQMFPHTLFDGFLSALAGMVEPATMKAAQQRVWTRRDELNQWNAYLQKRFVHDHDWLCDKFDLNHPSDLGSVVLA